MNRVDYYLDRISDAGLWPIVITAPILAVFAFLLIPARRRVDASLIIMCVWLTIGQLIEIGSFQGVIKATESGAFVLLWIAALTDPAPRRRLPGWTIVHLVLALISFIYIMTVRDFALALAIRVQWLFLVLAALQVARTITDEESLERILRALAIGLAVSLVFPLSALVVQGGDAFIKGLGRFEPYGANPNQIGTLFSAAAGLSAWYALRTGSPLLKPLMFTAASIAVGLALLTASRSTMVTLAIIAAPVAISVTKRPGLAIVGGVIFLAGLLFVFSRAEEQNLSRLTNFETERFEIFMRYLAVIADRPLFGLLTSRGESFMADQTVGSISHNAYIDLLRLGGVTYAIPLFVVAIYSSVCAWRVWRWREWIAREPLTISVLAAFTLAIYLHGFVNGAIFYPTYVWAFLHILLATLFMTWWSDIRSDQAPLVSDETSDEAAFYDDDGSPGAPGVDPAGAEMSFSPP